jgi:WD40-like Beta Propeller Repeat
MKKQRSYATTTATLFALVVIGVAILTVLISGLSLGCSVAAAQSQPVCFALVEKVAFTTTRDNPVGEIYLMNPDGSDPERITDNLWLDAFGVLSPDGKKIVFDSNRLRLPTDPILKVELFVMATDGTEQTHLTDGSSASWAPDSKHITFHASASGTGTMIREDPGAPTTDSDPGRPVYARNAVRAIAWALRSPGAALTAGIFKPVQVFSFHSRIS